MGIQKTLPTEVAERIKELGHRVRLARTRRGMSIAEVAAKAGINRNTLNALELGKPGRDRGLRHRSVGARSRQNAGRRRSSRRRHPRQDARGFAPAGARSQIAEVEERI